MKSELEAYADKLSFAQLKSNLLTLKNLRFTSTPLEGFNISELRSLYVDVMMRVHQNKVTAS